VFTGAGGGEIESVSGEDFAAVVWIAAGCGGDGSGGDGEESVIVTRGTGEAVGGGRGEEVAEGGGGTGEGAGPGGMVATTASRIISILLK
jgi:hypothetical protein